MRHMDFDLVSTTVSLTEAESMTTKSGKRGMSLSARTWRESFSSHRQECEKPNEMPYLHTEVFLCPRRRLPSFLETHCIHNYRKRIAVGAALPFLIQRELR
jgi:hypothetical protein